MQQRMHRAISVAVMVAGVTVAHAQTVSSVTPAQESPTSSWGVQLTPYVWGTGIGGTVRPAQGAPTGHVSESLSDVLKDLDAAFFMNAVLRKDKWVVHLDLTRASLSKSATVEAAPGVNIEGQAKIRQNSWGALAGYHWQQSSRSAWDWMGGIRSWDVHIGVQAAVPGVIEGSASASKSFVYPVAAARWRYQWNDRWSTLAYLDAGTQGKSDNYTWQGMVAVNYALQNQWYLSAGYRYLQLNYDKQGMYLDVTQQGPLLGVTYRF